MVHDIYFVFVRDAEGKPAGNPIGVYLDDEDRAVSHASRLGGVCVRVNATEVK